MLYDSRLAPLSKMIVAAAAACALCLPGEGVIAEEGTLDELRKAARIDDSPKKQSPPRPSHDDDDCRSDCDDDCANPFNELIGTGCLFLVTSPFWGPVVAMSDDGGQNDVFVPHPYFDGRIGGEIADDVDQPIRSKSWGGRFLADYADDFQGLQGVGGRLLLQNAYRFGLDSEFVYRAESLGASRSDEFWNGDANATFRFAQCDWGQMRTGLGMNWLADPDGTDLGVNFTYGGDFYPVRPFVLSADLDLGTLGEACLVHFRATGGVEWRGMEVFAGLDHYRLDDVDLTGLVSGVRVWF
jgi:hypothetical protein